MRCFLCSITHSLVHYTLCIQYVSTYRSHVPETAGYRRRRTGVETNFLVCVITALYRYTACYLCEIYVVHVPVHTTHTQTHIGHTAHTQQNNLINCYFHSIQSYHFQHVPVQSNEPCRHIRTWCANKRKYRTKLEMPSLSLIGWHSLHSLMAYATNTHTHTYTIA